MRISDWSSDVCSSDLELITAECADRHTPVHAPMTFHGAGLHIDVHVARGEAIAIGRLELHGSGNRDLLAIHAVDALLRSQDRRTVVEQDAGIGRASCRERVCQYV